MKSHVTKRIAALLLALCCVMTVPAGAFSVVSGDGIQTGTFLFSPHNGAPGEDKIDTYVYSDQFFADSAYTENKHLATMSMIMASASISSERAGYDRKSQNLEDLLTKLGFEGFATNDCYKSQPQTDTMGAAAAYKNVTINGQPYTLLAVVPRSAGYEREWAGNFTVGASGLHAGFNTARDRVLSFAKEYVAANQERFTGTLKFWTMGYSRGAATANLVGGFLVDCPDFLGVHIAPENLYVYTFGTPTCIPNGTLSKSEVGTVTAYVKTGGSVEGNWMPETAGGAAPHYSGPYGDSMVIPGDTAYTCIHNYYADYDPITMMPFPAWGFARYGVDHVYNLPANRPLMLQYLRDVNSTVYDIYINHGGDPDGFIAKKLDTVSDLSNGISFINDPDSPLTSQKLFLEDRVNFLSERLVGSRDSYVGNNYQHMLQTLMGLYFGLDESGKSAFTGGIGASVHTKPAAALLYVYYLTKNCVTSIDDALTYLTALRAQSPAGTDTSALDEMIARLTLAQNNHREYAEVISDLKTAAKDRLAWALGDGVDSINANRPGTITDEQKAIIVDDAVTVPLVDFASYLVFGTRDMVNPSDRNSILAAAMNQVATAATLISNAGSYMRVHNNEIILSWLRTQDSYYYYPTFSDSSDSGPSYYRLRFEVNGGDSLSNIRLKYGSKVDLTEIVPTREGYDFVGWYADAALTKPVTTITLNENTTLYAKWVAHVEPVENPFLDVSEADYYYNAVLWAVQYGITMGTTDTTFSPAATCTRAATVTFLWRAAGSPEPAQVIVTPSFTDVPEDAYYAKAVRWAAQEGITLGTADGRFDPYGVVTRAQAVTFLYRANGAAAGTGQSFADVNPGDYFADAVAWASDSMITTGTTDTTFSPAASCTRGQLVTFLYRCHAKSE